MLTKSRLLSRSPVEGGTFFLYVYCHSYFKCIFNWRIIAFQYCVGFCHISTWISHGLRMSPPSWIPPCHLPSCWSRDFDPILQLKKQTQCCRVTECWSCKGPELAFTSRPSDSQRFCHAPLCPRCPIPGAPIWDKTFNSLSWLTKTWTNVTLSGIHEDKNNVCLLHLCTLTLN